MVQVVRDEYRLHLLLVAVEIENKGPCNELVLCKLSSYKDFRLPSCFADLLCPVRLATHFEAVVLWALPDRCIASSDHGA